MTSMGQADGSQPSGMVATMSVRSSQAPAVPNEVREFQPFPGNMPSAAPAARTVAVREEPPSLVSCLLNPLRSCFLPETEQPSTFDGTPSPSPVSYTHLTLPTTLRV